MKFSRLLGILYWTRMKFSRLLGKDNLLYEKWIEQVVFVHTYVVVCYLSSEFYHQLKLITKKWMQC